MAFGLNAWGVSVVRDALAVMISLTTYGTSLREEERRWVDQDIIMPAQPIRQQTDRQGAEYPPLTLPRDQLRYVGTLIGTSLREQFGLRIWAMTVQMWYAHLVVAATAELVSRVVECAEQAAREGLQWDRPIWGDQYDIRFCFEEDSVRERIAYVERNNIAAGLPAKPWPFIEALEV
jgi:hypothetical protein